MFLFLSNSISTNFHFTFLFNINLKDNIGNEKSTEKRSHLIPQTVQRYVGALNHRSDLGILFNVRNMRNSTIKMDLFIVSVLCFFYVFHVFFCVSFYFLFYSKKKVQFEFMPNIVAFYFILFSFRFNSTRNNGICFVFIYILVENKYSVMEINH